MYTYYISVGSNIGNRRQYIESAYQALSIYPEVYRITASSILETEPWGYTDQDVFLNAVWHVTCEWKPHELLDILQKLEREAQRKRDIHWGPRTLDLDIVYALDKTGACMNINDARLVIPHPYFWDRLFVLEPLMELNKNFTYNGESIRSRIRSLQT